MNSNSKIPPTHIINSAGQAASVGQPVNSIVNPGGMIFKTIGYPKDPIFIHVGNFNNNVAKCNSCNEYKIIAFSYGKENVIKRDICEYCWLAGIDKQFGINSDSKTLEALYKKD